jgi:hypothetical protein
VASLDVVTAGCLAKNANKLNLTDSKDARIEGSSNFDIRAYSTGLGINGGASLNLDLVFANLGLLGLMMMSSTY